MEPFLYEAKQRERTKDELTLRFMALEWRWVKMYRIESKGMI